MCHAASCAIKISYKAFITIVHDPDYKEVIYSPNLREPQPRQERLLTLMADIPSLPIEIELAGIKDYGIIVFWAYIILKKHHDQLYQPNILAILAGSPFFERKS
jgi:hypothetical protein